MRLVNLWMLYAMHLNDNNSLFCVFTNLDDVMCSPNSRFITESMVSFLSLSRQFKLDNEFKFIKILHNYLDDNDVRSLNYARFIYGLIQKY
jgi:hypothetical protein